MLRSYYAHEYKYKSTNGRKVKNKPDIGNKTVGVVG